MKTITVAMLTYNHEKYIEKAIQSVLEQKTEYPVQLVIGEDASTDATADIIRMYKQKYSDKIQAILRTKNIGIKANSLDVLRQCQGDYVAYLEGDDYWTDPYKLQKQVDFLERHSDYVAVYHKCEIINEKGDPVSFDITYTEKKKYTIRELEKFLIPGQTSTLLVRNFWKDEMDLEELMDMVKYSALDRIVPVLALSRGKIYCMQQKMSVYRYIIQPGSWSYRFHRGDYLWRMYGFLIHREVEKIGKKLGMSISYRKLDAKLYSENIRKCIYYKKIGFLFLNFFMMLVGNHRFYMVVAGNRDLWHRQKKKRWSRIKNTGER
ncbi:Putative glycosyltransferase EpsE [Clostridiales bacterium CHKCI001]|nr:Putative glycosyltransferase EpsE [Clostridiales bacterium CHKCI001]